MKPDTLPYPIPAQAAQATTLAKNRRWPMRVFFLVGAAAAVSGGWFMSRPQASVPPASATQAATPVLELAQSDVGTIAVRPLQVTLAVAGSLVPAAQVVIKSRISGELQSSLVPEGNSVSKGQILAQLSNPESGARLAVQEASLEEANAKLSMAEKNSSANQLLLKQNFISQNAVDTSKNNVAVAQASVKSAQANAEIARINLADTVIRSPISGIVSRRHAQPGEKISPDAPIYTIVDLSQLTLEAQVPANEITRIKINQLVQFQVDGFANRTFTGKVARINPTTEAGSRSIMVHISVANPSHELKGGMFAKGSITTAQSAQGPVVALSAIRQQKGNNVVYTIENNTIMVRPVQLGLRNENDGLVEINAGLEAGSTVLLTPLPDVKPGSKVKLPSNDINHSNKNNNNNASTQKG